MKATATEMISANEARKITDSVNFRKSGFIKLIDSAIREAAGAGQSEATMLIPENVAGEVMIFLEQHGFRVIADQLPLLTAAW